MEFRAESLDDLQVIASKILGATTRKTFLLDGDLGAGKTSFIKVLCKSLGCNELVTSPTFSLVHHYITVENGDIFHFDFYRLKTVEEAMDMGFIEYLDRNSYVFIEWPERVMKLLLGDYVQVKITAEGNSRIIKVIL